MKQIYILAFGCFLSFFVFLMFRDALVTLMTVFSLGVGYYLLSKPPEDIQIRLNQDYVILEDVSIPLTDCKAWSMVNLDGFIEFVVHTTQINHRFYYFYIPKNSPQLKTFIASISQILPFDEKVAKANVLHVFLRSCGLK